MKPLLRVCWYKMKTNLLLDTAIRAALEAGRVIMKIYKEADHGILEKEDRTPLTKADLAAHSLINEHLQPTEIPVLSEEGRHIPFSERSKWDTLWLVDPIDGTKEFIKRNGEFTVNIALIHNNEPLLGVIFAPVLNMLYVGSKMHGSFRLNVEAPDITWKNVMEFGQKLPLPKAHQTYRVVASRSHLSQETKEFIYALETGDQEIELISKGSSLKLCLIAEGSADCYPRVAPTMEWDTAAGHAVCIGAGKSVKQFSKEEELVYNKENLLNPWFTAQ
jgi:3'(2'), 5'-bisphosphate nucleotidase